MCRGERKPPRQSRRLRKKRQARMKKQTEPKRGAAARQKGEKTNEKERNAPARACAAGAAIPAVFAGDAADDCTAAFAAADYISKRRTVGQGGACAAAFAAGRVPFALPGSFNGRRRFIGMRRAGLCKSGSGSKPIRALRRLKALVSAGLLFARRPFASAAARCAEYAR